MATKITRTPPKYEINGRDIRVTRPSENGQGTHIIWYPRKLEERISDPYYSHRADQSIETESDSVPLAVECGYVPQPEPFSRYSSTSVHASAMEGVIANFDAHVSSAEGRKPGRVLLTPSFSTDEFSNSVIDEDVYGGNFAGELTSSMLVPTGEFREGSDSAHTIRAKSTTPIARPRTPYSIPRRIVSAGTPSKTLNQPHAVEYGILADNNSERPRAATPYYIPPSTRAGSVYKGHTEASIPAAYVRPSDGDMMRAETPYYVPQDKADVKEDRSVAYAEAQALSPRSARRATLRSAKKKN